MTATGCAHHCHAESAAAHGLGFVVGVVDPIVDREVDLEGRSHTGRARKKRKGAIGYEACLHSGSGFPEVVQTGDSGDVHAHPVASSDYSTRESEGDCEL